MNFSYLFLPSTRSLAGTLKSDSVAFNKSEQWIFLKFLLSYLRSSLGDQKATLLAQPGGLRVGVRNDNSNASVLMLEFNVCTTVQPTAIPEHFVS